MINGTGANLAELKAVLGDIDEKKERITAAAGALNFAQIQLEKTIEEAREIIRELGPKSLNPIRDLVICRFPESEWKERINVLGDFQNRLVANVGKTVLSSYNQWEQVGSRSEGDEKECDFVIENTAKVGILTGDKLIIKFDPPEILLPVSKYVSLAPVTDEYRVEVKEGNMPGDFAVLSKNLRKVWGPFEERGETEIPEIEVLFRGRVNEFLDFYPHYRQLIPRIFEGLDLVI